MKMAKRHLDPRWLGKRLADVNLPGHVEREGAVSEEEGEEAAGARACSGSCATAPACPVETSPVMPLLVRPGNVMILLNGRLYSAGSSSSATR